EESENSSFVELSEVFLSLVGAARLPVWQVRKSFECRRTGRHPLGPELLERDRVPGNVEELVVAFLTPVLKGILVKQVDVFGDLRLSKHLFVLLRARADHARDKSCGGREMIGRERQALCVEVVDGQVAVGMNDDRARAFFDRSRVDSVAETFLNDDSVAEIAFGLGEKVA